MFLQGNTPESWYFWFIEEDIIHLQNTKIINMLEAFYLDSLLFLCSWHYHNWIFHRWHGSFIERVINPQDTADVSVTNEDE